MKTTLFLLLIFSLISFQSIAQTTELLNILQKDNLRHRVKSMTKIEYGVSGYDSEYSKTHPSYQQVIYTIRGSEVSPYNESKHDTISFIEYDINGKRIEKTPTASSIKENITNKKYNSKHQLIEYLRDGKRITKTYYTDDSVSKITEYDRGSYTENAYNHDGSLSVKEIFVDIGKPKYISLSMQLYNYSNEGYDITTYEKNINTHGQQLPVKTDVYDKHGNIIKETDLIFNRDNFKCSYDQYGNLTEYYEYDYGQNNQPNPFIRHMVIIYQYDGGGNWIKRVSIREFPNTKHYDESLKVTLRKIEYYQNKN